MRLKIRRAVLADAPAIAEVIDTSWKISYKNFLADETLLERDPNQILPIIEHDILSTKKTTWVALAANGEIVGMVSGGPANGQLEQVHPITHELYAIYVLPSHQNQGVGERLFKQFVQWLKKQQQISFFLWTLENNSTSRHFYEKLGGQCVARKIWRLTLKHSAPVVAYVWDNL